MYSIVTDKFHYDAANQLVREDSKSQDKTFQYLYDAGGNLKAIWQYAYTTGTLPAIFVTQCSYKK